jgi:recombination protein RecA
MEEISREVKSIVAENAGLVNLLPPRGAEDEIAEDQAKETEEAPLDGEEILELDVESPEDV